MSFLQGLLGRSTKGNGKKLGSSSSSQASQKGGHSSSSLPSSPYVFDVCFTQDDEKLGMHIIEDPVSKRPMVDVVDDGGSACKKGVRVQDRVLSIEGNLVNTFTDVETILALIASERPLTFRLERSFSDNGGNGERRAPLPLPAVDVKREMMMRAAEERNKKFAPTSKSEKIKMKEEARREAQEQMARFEKSQDEKTKQTVAHIKAMEALAHTRLGYNPYEPQYSSSSAANATMASAAVGSTPGQLSAVPLPPPAGRAAMTFPPLPTTPSPTTSVPPLYEHELQCDTAVQASEEVDIALSLLFEQPRDEWTLAVATCCKILKNILLDPANEKYRRLRLTNPTFQTKVQAVPGAAQLLHAAGFRPAAATPPPTATTSLTTPTTTSLPDDDSFLTISEPPAPSLPLATRVVYHRLTQILEQIN